MKRSIAVIIALLCAAAAFGCARSPVFRAEGFTLTDGVYVAEVPHGVADIKIRDLVSVSGGSLTLYAQRARYRSLIGAGESVALNVGSNIFFAEVELSRGDVKVYVLNVIRLAA